MKNVKKNSYANENGLTLVEVLASIVLLMIVLITFIHFFPQMATTNHKNIERNRAINIAREELLYWQGKLVTELEAFKENATKKSCFIEGEATFCYEFQTDVTHDKYSEKFDTSITLWEKSDLDFDLEHSKTDAYRLHIEIKNKENGGKLSEIFGYVYIERGGQS